MRKQTMNNRDRLTNAALKLSYRRGFGNAALSDIAEEAGVPLGNVYYYFKTKDDIGAAIVDLRLGRLHKLLAELDDLESPKERLCGFVQIKIDRRDELARFGCPVGTLTAELHKDPSPLAKHSTALYEHALAWMATQFAALGHRRDARNLALHLLSCTQGVSLLAHAFHDPQLIVMEAARLKSWIRSL
jgi:AcrR family transcriptional regulator